MHHARPVAPSVLLPTPCRPCPAPAAPCSGTLYSVKAPDIKYVLPGGAARTAADLAAVEAAAAAEVAKDDGLLLLAWELASGEGEQVEGASGARPAIQPAAAGRGGAARAGWVVVPAAQQGRAALAGSTARACLRCAALRRAAGTPPIFTVPQMADLLFNGGDPASCAAALRLLRDDRLYFKQASARLAPTGPALAR